MNALDNDNDRQSYFSRNARRIEKYHLDGQAQAFKALLISFLTIKEYRDFLFDPAVHLKKHVTEEFVNEVMIPDFGSVILTLQNFTGRERRGLREAQQSVESAQGELYKEGDQISLVESLMNCRTRLHDAYLQLEYLETYLSGLPPYD